MVVLIVAVVVVVVVVVVATTVFMMVVGPRLLLCGTPFALFEADLFVTCDTRL